MKIKEKIIEYSINHPKLRTFMSWLIPTIIVLSLISGAVLFLFYFSEMFIIVFLVIAATALIVTLIVAFREILF